MRRIQITGLIIGLALESASFAAANSQLDEITVTASRSEQALRHVASSISVVNGEALALVDPTHISEALSRAPGVWISRGNGQEHLTAIRSPVLTGAGSCGAFLMMQDGIPVRAPGFCNVNELFEGSTELAGRIEVLKGPGSSMHGSNAMHGVINILTPDIQPGLRSLSLLGGPYDYFRSKLSASNDQWRLDLSATTDGGYKDDSGFDQQKFIIRNQYADETRTVTTTVSYTNLNQETAGFVQGPEVYKQAGVKRDNPNPEAYRDARSYRLVSQIEQPLAQGDLLLKPYLRHTEMIFLQHFLPGQAIEENGHNSIGMLGLWTSSTGQWRAGLELDYTRGYLEEFQPGPTGGSPFLDATIPQGKHYDYDVDAFLAGVFFQYDRQFSNNLLLTAGLRFQSVRYDYQNNMISGNTRDDGSPCGFGGCRFSRPDDRKNIFNDWSPKLGLIWEVSGDNQIFASLSRGYRAPQATELYRLQGGQDVASIDPVQLDAFETGIRGERDALDYNISLYLMRKDNFIFRDTNRMVVDNGETSHKGIEIETGYRFSEKWSARLAMTYARHQYENNPALSTVPLKDNDIDTAPRTLGSAQLSWTPGDQLRLELEWIHMGRYYEDPENEQPYDGHNLVHLRADWQVTPRASLQFRIMNLTDIDYAERADFAFGNDRYFVGTPRSVFIGARLNL